GDDHEGAAQVPRCRLDVHDGGHPGPQPCEAAKHERIGAQVLACLLGDPEVADAVVGANPVHDRQATWRGWLHGHRARVAKHPAHDQAHHVGVDDALLAHDTSCTAGRLAHRCSFTRNERYRPTEIHQDDCQVILWRDSILVHVAAHSATMDHEILVAF